MKISSMKLYFGTLVEHQAENLANAECCGRIWEISTSRLAYNSNLHLVNQHRINPGGSGQTSKPEFTNLVINLHKNLGSLSDSIFRRLQTSKDDVHSDMASGAWISSGFPRWCKRRCEADTSKLVHVRRSRALSFGGVLNLTSSWKLASSTKRSGGAPRPERAGPRLKKNGNGISKKTLSIKVKLVVDTTDQDSTRESVASAWAHADGWFQ